MSQQAPPITTKIRLLNVAANYISFEWDSVAPGYTYIISRKKSGDAWVVLKSDVDLYSALSYYDSGLDPLSTYDYEIKVIGPGLLASAPAYLNNITTFETNAYSVSTASQVRLYNSFSAKRFEQDDISITTGSTKLVLMRPSYKFDEDHKKITDAEVAAHKMIANSNIQVWGRVPNACGGYGCSIPSYLSGNAIIFDRKQRIVKISTDKGKTWYTRRALPKRAGNPYHENIYSHNGAGLFVLGYENIMIINDETSIHWSNTEVHFSDPSITFDEENKVGSLDLQFANWVNYPPGVLSGKGHAIGSDAEYVYFADASDIYRCEIATKLWDINSTSMPARFACKEFVTYNGIVYAFCPGLSGPNTQEANTEAGIYDISSVWLTPEKVYGNTPEERANIHPMLSNLSRDDSGMILGVNPQHYYNYPDGELIWNEPNPQSASNARPFRDQLYITTGSGPFGLDFNVRNERWQYEEQYIYNGYEDSNIPSWPRMRVNDTNYISVITAIQEYEQFVSLTDIYSQGATTITIDPASSVFIGYPGYVNSAILYNSDTDELIAVNSLNVKTKNTAEFSWLLPDIVARGVLQTYVAPPVEVEDLAKIPSLTPYTERFLPDHYSYREPKFVEFLRQYLKYISDGSLSNYGQLHTMLSSHDANESTVFVDMFESDLMRRNIYVDDATRKTLNTFLYNTARDFYSIKGTVDSYKFLFRLLYGETVNVKVENTYDFTFEYDILVGDKNGAPLYSVDAATDIVIGQSISGHKLYQSDSRGTLNAIISDVPSYCEIVSAQYRGVISQSGHNFARYTIRTINTFGDFTTNMACGIDSIDDTFLVSVYSEPEIVQHSYSVEEQSKQFNFVLRLESELPYSRYYNDVITFVHPVGFDFIGSYLIASFVTTEVPPSHIETIIQYSDSVRWDNGIPSVYPDFVGDLDTALDYQFTTQTYLMNDGSVKHALKVKEPRAYMPGDVEGQPTGAILTGSITPSGSYYTENPPSTVYTLDVDGRRTKASPLFDGSSGRFFDRINNPDTNNVVRGSDLVSLNRCRINRVRLKDNLSMPLDPAATQRKNVHL